MDAPPKLSLAELRDIVVDASELAKGTRFYDDGGLSHLARYEHKLYADAAGSSTYKVQIHFEKKGTRARCSCFAARTRPFCKHGAALLVAWARAPESFAEAPAPAAEEGGPRRREVKKGKVDAKAVMGRGVEQAATLVRELASAGVASVSFDRVDQVRSLSEALREARLRRMAGRTLKLAEHLEKAASQLGTFDASEYAELIADMLLTVRKLEKHLAGEPLQDEHVEELIGKTWTKKDRRPIADLDLVEYSFDTRTTPDEFVIRQSRFIELNGGDHFSEKQILPGFLVKRTTPKRSYAGRVLGRTSGSIFPSFSPRRLDIESIGETAPLDAGALGRLLSRCVPDASAALAALQERRKDVFAPESLPIALRVERVFADGSRLSVVDHSSAALFLPDDADAEETLARVLRGAKLAALIGDVALDGAVPTLFPLAAIVDGRDGLELCPLGGLDVSTLLVQRKLKKLAVKPTQSRWVETARRAGLSAASIALGEVREEMAHGLATGLASVTPRFTDPLSSRLADLGLKKQAELLSDVATRSDPSDKLDDFIKLHQVLAIALVRLVGSAHVSTDELEPAPTYDSVFVRRVVDEKSPAEVAELRGAGKMNRYEAAVHYDRHFAALPVHEIVGSVYPIWADGSAAPYVCRVAPKAPEAALEAARRVLAAPGREPQKDAPQRATSRVAKLTAIRVLESLGSPEARDLLAAFARTSADDRALVSQAQRAVCRLAGERSTRRVPDDLLYGALNASTKDGRIAALRAIGEGGFLEAIPVLRASLAQDPAADVRAAAAHALAKVGDVEVVDRFVRMLAARGEDPAAAKVAAQALGILGDARGIGELVRAFGEGWHPTVVGAALRDVGPVALGPLIDRILDKPDLAGRKAAMAAFAELPAADVEAALVSRLESDLPLDEQLPQLTVLLAIAVAQPTVGQGIAGRIRALHPQIFEKTASKEAKTLAKRVDKAQALASGT